MYAHSFLWHYLWIAPHALQLIIAIVMIRRRLFNDFPVFLTYTIFQAIAGTVLFILDHMAAVSGYQYWYAHWTVSLSSTGLRFGVIWEVFRNIFRDYPGLQRLTRVVFRTGLVVFLFVAIVIAARAPEVGSLHILSRVHILDLFMDIIQTGLWMLLIGLSYYFGLSRGTFAYGIVFGLGIFSTVDLATEAIRVWTGFIAGHAFDLVSMATYHCCVVVWLVYLLAPETIHRTPKELPNNNLEQWNAELQRLLVQ
jgi:hypothetical protein